LNVVTITKYSQVECSVCGMLKLRDVTSQDQKMWHQSKERC